MRNEATPKVLWRACQLAARCILGDGWREGKAFGWIYRCDILDVNYIEEDEIAVLPASWAEPLYLELFDESREKLAYRIYAAVRGWKTWGECMDAGMASLRSWAGVR